MATQEGWVDFKRLVELWQGTLTMISTLKNSCDALTEIKEELIDDKDKYSAMVAIGNQYPEFNMNSIAKDVERVITAKATLVAAGF